MRKILLAFVVTAAAQAAPAAYAACAESHGSMAHVHSRECGSSFIFQCPIPSVVVHTSAGDVGFACD